MMLLGLSVAGFALALAAAVMVAINLVCYRTTPLTGSRSARLVSVLIPARDE